MDLTALPPDERERLAGDATTDPAVLTGLAGDFFLLPLLAANPATPPDVRDGIFRDFPHLRPADSEAPPASTANDVDDAVAAFKRRQGEATRVLPRKGRRARSGERYVRVVQDDGRIVWMPAGSLGRGGTNGFAIASLVLAVGGLSLLAVIFGHVALAQLDRDGGSGDGLATGGLIIGYLGLVVYALLWLPL